MTSIKKKSISSVDIKFIPAQLGGDGMPMDIVHNPSGDYLYTCGGSESVIKVFQARERSEISMKQLEYHKEPINALCMNKTGDRLASCSDDHTAVIYRIKHPQNSIEFDKLAAKFNLPVRHVSFSYEGSLLAAGGDDGTIKMVLILDPSQCSSLKGHEGPVRSLAFDPKNIYLVSSGCDGSLRIWNIETATLVTSLSNLLPKTESSDFQYGRMSWHPSGKLLAIPGSNEIRCLERDSWKISFVLKGGHSKPITMVCWSSNGRYLASIGLDAQLMIWDIGSKETLHRYQHDALIASISWNPRTNAIALIDIYGKLGIWNNPIPPKFPVPYIMPQEIPENLLEKTLANVSVDQEDMSQIETEIFSQSTTSPLEEDNHLFNVNDVIRTTSTTSATASLSLPIGTVASTASELTIKTPLGTSLSSSTSSSAKLSTHSIGHSSEPALGIDSKNNIKRPERRSGSLGIESDLDQEDMQRNSQKRKRKQEVLGNTVWLASSEEKYFQEPQKAFQPTASELDRKRRFLVFNKIGTITARDESTHFAIEISFHDISRNRIIKLVDRNNSTMADLGENGAVFASKIKASILSTILYHPIESWGSNAKWSIQLPAEEEVDAICLGETIVAAATNRSFLRLFTFSGVQYHLFSLHGPIVSMTAFKRQLAVIYHGGMPFLGNQNLQLLLLDTSKRSIIHQGPVAIASYSTLRWLGFSPSGILVVHDSAGVVRMLLDDWKQWTPVQILQPNEWVFGVSDQYLHCVSLKDDEQSPPLVPKPIPHTIPLCIPLLQKELDTTAFEEAFLRESLITKHKEHLLQDAIEVKEKVLLDTYLMQLIENAIRTDRTERALNLADMIQFEKPLLGVINMAHQRGLRILKEKLEGLLERKFPSEREKVFEEDVDSDEDTNKADNEPENLRISSEKPSKSKSSEILSSPKAKNHFSSSPKETSSSLLSSTESYVDYSDEESSSSLAKESTSNAKNRGNLDIEDQQNDDSSQGKPRKRNRFALDKPVKTVPSSGLFESLNILQKSAQDPKQRKGKLPSLLS